MNVHLYRWHTLCIKDRQTMSNKQDNAEIYLAES